MLARLRSNSSKSAVLLFSAFADIGKETKIPLDIWKTMVDRRLGNSLFAGAPCHDCANGPTTFEAPLDGSGHHAASCSRSIGSTSRHNALRDPSCTRLSRPFVSLQCKRDGYFTTERYLLKHRRRRLDIAISEPLFFRIYVRH